MSSRLADHLGAARRHRFVGREVGRTVFRSALMAEKLPFYLLYLFGPGGVGKSTLLQEFMALCRQQTVSAISIDARHLEPSPDAFILALQVAMGLRSETSALETLGAQPHRSIIFIDTYEKLAPQDGWLREVFLPQPSENILLVLAGREALSAGWRIDPGWNTLIRTLALRNFIGFFIAPISIPPKARNWPPKRLIFRSAPIAAISKPASRW